METFSGALALGALALEASLLFRAAKGGFLSKYPLFFSYLGYVFAGSLVTLVIYLVRVDYYPSVYWFFYLIMLLAEFAVLTEASDHMFSPYPAIGRLGRFLTVWLAVVLASIYILPSLFAPKSTSTALLDLAKRASLVKAAMIVILLVASRYYRLSLGRNISGMILGFGIYLSVSVVNFAAADAFGHFYAPILKVLFPVSYTLCLIVWAAALWRYEPALPVDQRVHELDRQTAESLSSQLGRFNNALTRLLRR